VTEVRPANLELFPTDIQRIDPLTKGIDNLGSGLGFDGNTYVLKSQSIRRELPMSEWLAYAIAAKCQLPIGVPRICRLPNSELVFGSKWASGVYTNTSILNTPVQLLQQVVMPERLYGVVTLDVFLGNKDRHQDNLLFVQSNGQTNFEVIDFSRALLYYERLPDCTSVSKGGSWTAQFLSLMKDMHRVSFTEAERVAESLLKINADHLKQEIEKAPAEWKTSRCDAMLEWWASDLRQARIDEIKNGIWNGTLI
jgi:hypothetical protein